MANAWCIPGDAYAWMMTDCALSQSCVFIRTIHAKFPYLICMLSFWTTENTQHRIRTVGCSILCVSLLAWCIVGKDWVYALHALTGT